MRIHLCKLIGLVFLCSFQAHASIGPYYNPTNAASPSGYTVGYELFRTIGCPGKALLDVPCPAPVAVAEAPAPVVATPAPTAAAAAPEPEPAPAPASKPALKGVNFAFDSAELEPQAKPILDQAAETLKADSYPAVHVNGYTDAIGPTAYNVDLSVRRARSVKRYLIDRGVPESSLVIEGHGETDFVASNETKAGRRENRRVALSTNG